MAASSVEAASATESVNVAAGADAGRPGSADGCTMIGSAVTGSAICAEAKVAGAVDGRSTLVLATSSSAMLISSDCTETSAVTPGGVSGTMSPAIDSADATVFLLSSTVSGSAKRFAMPSR